LGPSEPVLRSFADRPHLSPVRTTRDPSGQRMRADVDGQAQADARGDLDWDLHFVDATVVRAHQHAAGARRSSAIGG
jgi:hypothetical protein